MRTAQVVRNVGVLLIKNKSGYFFDQNPKGFAIMNRAKRINYHGVPPPHECKT